MIKRLWIISALMLAVLVLPTTSYATPADDFDKGYAAYQTGDFKQAVKYFRLAAEQGDAAAQYNLGIMYEFGSGVVKNEKQALKYYTLAAKQGYADAQFNLGVMYRRGRGVVKNDRQAVHYYRLAAEQGDALAQHNLGRMYANGEGVPKNDQIAYQWILLAAAHGNEVSKEGVTIIEKNLTLEQRGAAQKAAAQWQEAFDAR